MEVARKDLLSLRDQAGDQLVYRKADTVFIGESNVISSKNIQFGFAADQPKIWDGGKTDGGIRNFELPTMFHILDAAAKLLYSVFLGPSESIKLDDLIRHWGELGNTKDRMQKIDWTYDYSDDRGVREKGAQEVKQLTSDLCVFAEVEKRALIQSMWERYVPRYTVRVPEFLEIKQKIMKSEDFEFNQRQFKAAGMLDHFTSEVVKQMSDGLPKIREIITPVIDGEQVKGTLHLNKTKEGDRYFLNKFDLEKEKPNGSTVKQTFYNNNRPKPGEEESGRRQPQQWTQKRAFNFLSGRPIYDKNNDEWNKINLSKKLQNGNYATDRFDKNYGFSLAKTMSGYSYADAGDPQKMAQLAEGFERGNLQKVKLVDNSGKKEDYYQSISIRTGSMRIFDKDKKEIPLEQQVAKGLITNELADKLVELFANKQKQAGEKVEGGQVMQAGEKSNETQKETQKDINKVAATDEAKQKVKPSHKH
ncbi:hypothetical protein [Paraflavitalea pollutisoli]|uniref:hypothetical protein n=1 Tax=Paraflavitalea pollutisoli TaxID=3034143 RepID=UPI0023EDA0B0|nr:hypothetical protein [Paraflavitalea sp. H1-2-19X]